MSDTFKRNYSPVSSELGKKIETVKEAFEMVENHLIGIKSREMSLAITNLEQACMWAVKAICIDDETKTRESRK